LVIVKLAVRFVPIRTAWWTSPEKSLHGLADILFISHHASRKFWFSAKFYFLSFFV